MHPITEYPTVQQCLLTSMKVSHKLQQTYTFVMMDLAAAKIAYDIKWHNPQMFKNVIIHLGGFHVLCSYMGAIGKLTSGSSLEEIIRVRSLCQRFNRESDHWKALQPCRSCSSVNAGMLFTSLSEKLNSSASLGLPPPNTRSLADNLISDSLNEVLNSVGFHVFAERYENYRSEVCNGEHGKSAKFWLSYMDSV